MDDPNNKTKPQSKSKVPTPLPPRQLLWHCLMGMTLGVICAGLLLQIGGTNELIGSANTLAARLQFLLGVAFFFGVGATLTGVVFLINERSSTG
jgi:hypothetical protein